MTSIIKNICKRLAGEMKNIDTICRRLEVGKLTRSALYIHHSVLVTMPAEIQEIVEEARRMLALKSGGHYYGDNNVIKIRRDGTGVSLLWYGGFDIEGHPPLWFSKYIPLDYGQKVCSREWAVNAPILHRKETLVNQDFHKFHVFKELTRAEEEAGLLENPPGFKMQWEQRLRENGFRVEGHTLSRI